MGNILPPDLVPDPAPDPAPEPEPNPAPERSLDHALIRDPRLRDLFERLDAHLAEARRLQVEIRRAVGALAGSDDAEADAEAGPAATPVIIRKDPGRTMRARLNAVEGDVGPGPEFDDDEGSAEGWPV